MPLAALSGAPVTGAYPYRDTRQTVGKLLELHRWCFADPRTFARILTRVETLVQNLDPKDYASEYAAIFHAACRDVRYLRDPVPVELVKSPDVLLDEIDRRGFAGPDGEDEIRVEIGRVGIEVRRDQAPAQVRKQECRGLDHGVLALVPVHVLGN